VVWTGDELVVWGGEGDADAVDTGAAYDPITETWRAIAPAPIPPRSDHIAVWMDGEMFVCCGGVDPASPNAAYDPAADSWRLLAGQPELQPVRGALGRWTGSTVVVRDGTDGRVFTYDPTNDQWFDGGAVPPVFGDEGTWAGSETWVGPQPGDSTVWDEARQRLLIYLGSVGDEQFSASAPGDTEVVAYYPASDSLAQLPSVPTRQDRPEMAVAGDLLVLGTDPFYALDVATTVENPIDDAPATIVTTDPITPSTVSGPPSHHLGQPISDLPAFEPATDVEQAIVDAVHQAFAGPYNAATRDGYEDAEELDEAFDRGLEAYPQHAEGTSAIVWEVVVLSDTEAHATFDIVDDGRAVTATTIGLIVLLDGDWQVSQYTFCELMARARLACP
jgi:hypothetical protein